MSGVISSVARNLGMLANCYTSRDPHARLRRAQDDTGSGL